MRNGFGTLMLVALHAAVGFGGCGGDDDVTSDAPEPEQPDPICAADDECYPDVADGALVGDALCSTDVRDGYCTHTCTADEDCCAAEGECATDLEQVCSPYQSDGQAMCFVSCEPDDLPWYHENDEQAHCQGAAGRDFVCRSSGAGSEERKICVPGDCGVGAACDEDEDCSGDLSCMLDALGGYCTITGCSGDGDCPSDARCVSWDDTKTYCAVNCDSGSDCSFCRGDELRGKCIGFTPAPGEGDPIQVCVPYR
jgi:hypothetical protein